MTVADRDNLYGFMTMARSTWSGKGGKGEEEERLKVPDGKEKMKQNAG